MVSLDPRLDPNRPWRQLAARAIIVVGIAALVAFYVAQNPGSIGEDRVALEVSGPSRIARADLAGLDLELTLANRTGLDVTLSASNPCVISRWILLTGEGGFVQSKLPEEDCPAVPMSALLPADAREPYTLRVGIDPRRVSPGFYVVKVQLWGYEGEHRMTVTE